MYKAIVQDGFNNKEPESTLKLVERPIPDAEPGHIVVQIKLRPINPVDLNSIRTGRFAQYTNQPIVPGSEGYGIIHKVKFLKNLEFPKFTITPLCSKIPQRIKK